MPPPREIPGFYFDEEKNRYFPGTKPKAKTVVTNPSQIIQASESNASHSKANEPASESSGRHAARTSTLSAMTQLKRLGHHAAIVRQNNLVLKDRLYEITEQQYLEEVNDEATIITHMAATSDGNNFLITGDNHHRVRTYLPQEFSNRDIRTGAYFRRSSQVMYVSSQITSVAVARQKFIATSFGPKSTIVCGNVRVVDDEIVEQTYLLSSPKIRDIWTSYFDGRTLTLGIKNGVARISNLAIPGFDIRALGSDTFSVTQHQYWQVLAGLRNGSVCSVDFRVPTETLDELLPPANSPVTHLSALRESELLVARLDGQLDVFDLRWVRDKRSQPTPVLSLYGNPPCPRIRMTFAQDSLGDYLFAGGEDCRIRGWNTRSGNRLQHPPPSEVTESSPVNLLEKTFREPMPALLMTRDESNEEILRVADGPYMRIFSLGKKYSSDMEF
ncbi:hypothetical protein FRC02_008643 [Tulasnella sp. 418]|nr:hypothetical protein FRC02_008643 [Tulasnella sp. 418]